MNLKFVSVRQEMQGLLATEVDVSLTSLVGTENGAFVAYAL